MAVTLYLLVLASDPSASLVCSDPTGRQKVTTSIAEITRSAEALRREVEGGAVHVLDLPRAVHERRRLLPGAIAAQNWCAAFGHFRVIETALKELPFDEDFVADKFIRVERWVRNSGHSEASKNVRLAAVALTARQFEESNHQLNEATRSLFGDDSLWAVPKDPNQVPDVEAEYVISEPEMRDACPEMAKTRRGGKTELNQQLQRLRRRMNKKTIRVTDVDHGENLAANISAYVELTAYWPAVRCACVLFDRIDDAEIGLGVVMSRFSLASKLRKAGWVPAGQDKRFKELLRGASASLSTRGYDQAHEQLEQLLVLLGEPKRPGDVFDGLLSP